MNDIAAPTPPPSPVPADTAGPFHVERDFAGRQYVGYREKQEDYYAFADASDKKEKPVTKLLVALGDGLGAHIGGNVASYQLVSEFVKAYKRSTLSVPWRMRVSLESANESLRVISNRLNCDKAPMGSTFVGIVVTQSHLHWVSVGDSLLYLFRKDKLIRLNADHSLAPLLDERVKKGEMTEEEAAHHPDRHVLQSACMGLPLTLVDARMEPYPIESGDIIVVASDGLLTLDMDQIEEMLTFGKTSPAGKLVDALVFAVRCAEHPKQDNTTVALVKVP
ncbi:protein phosphatase [Roseimicrobium gellanilyticum]|uniref:Protein phosphatase n=1 Tax=Roseimicrobium gellanilyticum TaxID=748857 RepID=A0A366HUD7_9BACT|nr:protein phosphatase 2C domain-containing protein [Roseimicrobium gellanilyticum]RBP46524.1 protein phosphatase [Roseimicrobium gellanilyticum]